MKTGRNNIKDHTVYIYPWFLFCKKEQAVVRIFPQNILA